MPSLYDSRPGTTVRITGIDPGQAGGSRRRLLEFGFVPGADVTVIARGATGGLLVGLGDTRVALDTRTAGRLRCAG
ncbi:MULTISPECIES: FeoA family protein [unclassified Streptomyces]|uniref:FeoA family protein n=1 Tax=unclassified Streptomyces TaxID=2593676 RepID=UPI00224DB251|nr:MULTISPECIES: FeoA family protein [unclassified Streptomyces]MCX5126548.1 ferrous iron transport protein A [Streptomyces sp. NBC_00347]WSK24389.1 FeoA family protein [Streptomyces sp. NBC_01298]